MKESAKASELAKRSAARSANPTEAYPKAGKPAPESSASLSARSGGSSAALEMGYTKLDLDLDPFDNERNFDRMQADPGDAKGQMGPEDLSYDQLKPSPGNGPRKNFNPGV